jgi:endonuclease YncB( thermonuclease family)
MRKFFVAFASGIMVMACNFNVSEVPSNNSGGGGSVTIPNADEVGVVVDVIDGDTADIEINGRTERVRFVGVNTPERDEPCYSDAKSATESLMPRGTTVSLVRDVSNTDRFDRLLRYIYVGNTFVNRELIVQGYAEAVLYGDDDRHWAEFVELEGQASASGRGCHPSGIFNDGTQTR